MFFLKIKDQNVLFAMQSIFIQSLSDFIVGKNDLSFSLIY